MSNNQIREAGQWFFENTCDCNAETGDVCEGHLMIAEADGGDPGECEWLKLVDSMTYTASEASDD